MIPTAEIRRLLTDIYGEAEARAAAARILPLIRSSPGGRDRRKKSLFSEKDMVLITYADSLLSSGEAPLKTLARFASKWFDGVFSTVHLLPFYPWSSDDGFSVIDFFEVDPQLGEWADIHELGGRFALMFDFVLNHISSKSPWFSQYLKEASGFEDLAIEVPPDTDLSQVTRPRALPLLTAFQKKSGKIVHVWTTFSEDQIDLNYKSLSVLERMIEVLLFYLYHGAEMIRMDAVAYLWKQIGTACIHLPQTHALVKLFRRILDVVAPDTVIITETNVPHEENLSYFGRNGDEAQLVYNFSLPPLLLHTLARGNSEALSTWARRLPAGAPNTTFFNFTASHDGIGVRPLEGILPKSEIDYIIDRVTRNGGRVSYKADANGAQSPYELNITYVDAMKDPDAPTDKMHAVRFLASQAIAQVLPGVPGVYVHSMLGSRNWYEGIAQTGRHRTINREKLQADLVDAELRDGAGPRAEIYFPYREMIRIRRSQPAFHPNAGFSVVDLGPRLFAVLRTGIGQRLLAVTNVSAESVGLVPEIAGVDGELRELFSGKRIRARDSLTLAPYRYAWFMEDRRQ
jgi:sucrose phosphorylase